MGSVINARLAELAEAYGVATWYEDWRSRRVDVRPEAVIAVLGLLGVDASTDASAERELAEVRSARTQHRLPPTVVLRTGRERALQHPGDLTLESGERRALTDRIPADLPLGWHSLRCGGQEITVVIVPEGLPPVPPTWGWMLQLYAVHSAGSWGLGDLGDLAEFVRWAGSATGAGLVLLNPLHAPSPVHPVPASPYSPSSRRFTNPLYLRIADTGAYRAAEPTLRAKVDALRPATEPGALIDYDEVWRAKRTALELLWPLVRADARALAGADDDLIAYATYCALAELHGTDWQAWPEELRHPDSPAVAAARVELADRIGFHTWLQALCDEQLGAAGAAAADAGMPIGIVHDLAVGIDPSGADAWRLRDVLAEGVKSGAPPDAFNQHGQDWGLAAWRPDRLAATGYRAYRDMLRGIFRHAGGLRVDHVAGLWRLWWVPPGSSSADGTYVSYDPEAMVGILALEAHRAGAVVIGEDLGTVLPIVTQGLQEQNMLGSAVMWFARDPRAWDDGFLPPEAWQPNALASISTHDLPTAAGFLTGEHVRLRARLNLLGGSLEEEQHQAETERRQLLELLRDEGLLALDPELAELSDGQVDEVIVAMHALLARSSCRLIVASPYDVLGEVRQPNLPGTVEEYPNWRMPLPVSLEEFQIDPRVRRIADLLAARGTGSPEFAVVPGGHPSVTHRREN